MNNKMSTSQSETPPAFSIPGYLTAAEAMGRSGLSRSQITHLCRRGPDNGGIRGIKLAPRLWLVETASLDEYLHSNPKPGPKRKRRSK